MSFNLISTEGKKKMLYDFIRDFIKKIDVVSGKAVCMLCNVIIYYGKQ
jgi:hypothetical protein